MSNAAWRPAQGSWGFMGTDPNSGRGKIRRMLDDIGEGGQRVMPETMGEHELSSVSYKDIPDLGSQQYFKRGGNTYASPTNFKKHWYKPYKAFAMEDPLKQMKGIGTSEAPGEGEWMIDTSQGDVQAASGVVAEDRIMPADVDISGLLLSAEMEKEKQFGVYEGAISDLDTQEKEGKASYKTLQDETATARREAAMGAVSEHEQAQIQEAATGMAYSAPAQKGYEMQGSTQTMGDIAGAAGKGRVDYLKGERKIKEGRAQAETDWSGAQQQFNLDVASAYDAADSALQNTLDTLEGMMGQHQRGGSLGASKIKGVKGMFTEGESDFADYGTNMGLYKKAKTYQDAIGLAATNAARPQG